LLGLDHGVFCVGCCWAIMLLMFVVGSGSVGWMLLLGAIMAAEKEPAVGRASRPAIRGSPAGGHGDDRHRQSGAVAASPPARRARHFPSNAAIVFTQHRAHRHRRARPGDPRLLRQQARSWPGVVDGQIRSGDDD
jgi:hypothetical protein